MLIMKCTNMCIIVFYKPILNLHISPTTAKYWQRVFISMCRPNTVPFWVCFLKLQLHDICLYARGTGKNMLYFCRTCLQRNTKKCCLFVLVISQKSSRLVLSSCMMASPSFPWTSYISLASWNVFIHYVGNECGRAYCILGKIQMLTTAVIIVRHSHTRIHFISNIC
jgi:hypothetical protein